MKRFPNVAVVATFLLAGLLVLSPIVFAQTTTTYKGMSVRTPDPTGEAGLAWQNNFKELADRVGPCNFAAVVAPGVTNDTDEDYEVGSLWYDTVAGKLYWCADNTDGAAVWVDLTTVNHDAVTLSVDLAANLLGLASQQITLDSQSANLIFAGPTTGAAEAPSFRSLVAGDVPDLSSVYQTADADLTTYAGITPSANVQTMLGSADNAAIRTNIGLGTIATQNANVVAITGGTINGTSVGATTRAAGAFTSVGVGTSSPATLLDLESATSVGLGLLMQSADDTNYGFAITFGAALPAWANALAPNGRVDSVGNYVFNPGSAGNLYFGYDTRASSYNNFDGVNRFNQSSTTKNSLFYSNRIGVNEDAPDYKLDLNGTFGFTPGTSVTPIDNGDVTLDFPTNTTFAVRGKGSDATVRAITLPLTDSTALVASNLGSSVQAYDADLAALAAITGVDGDVLLYNSGWTRLAKGSENQVLKMGASLPAWGTDATGAGGSAIIFDIGDDGGNDSIDVNEIATTGDTNAIFTEPTADKILIDLTKKWPAADTATTATTATTANAGDSATAFFSSGTLENTLLDADLQTWAGVTPSANGQSLVAAADYAAMKTLLDLEIGTDILAQQTIGIADNNLLEVDDADNLAVNDYAKVTANGIVGRTYSQVKEDLSLNNVANVELATAHSCGASFDGGGSAITAASKAYVRVPFSGTITGVYLVADQTGSIVIDVWKDTFANSPPTDADSITALAVPTISADTKGSDTTLTDWATTVTAGDVIGFNVDSCSTITKCSIELAITRN